MFHHLKRASCFMGEGKGNPKGYTWNPRESSRCQVSWWWWWAVHLWHETQTGYSRATHRESTCSSLSIINRYINPKRDQDRRQLVWWSRHQVVVVRLKKRLTVKPHAHLMKYCRRAKKRCFTISMLLVSRSSTLSHDGIFAGNDTIV